MLVCCRMQGTCVKPKQQQHIIEKVRINDPNPLQSANNTMRDSNLLQSANWRSKSCQGYGKKLLPPAESSMITTDVQLATGITLSR